MTIADTELTLDQIGEANIPSARPRSVQAPSARGGEGAFNAEAGRFKLFHKRLLKLLAYRAWVLEWDLAGEQGARNPTRCSETTFATEIAACFADLDDISSVSDEGMDLERPRRALETLGRSDQGHERPCRRSLCAALHLLTRSSTAAAGAKADPLRRGISDFFERATAGRTTSPELDIAIKSIVAAAAAAAVWGYIAVMPRPTFELEPGNPGVGASSAALSALCLYGPAIALPIWSNAHVSWKPARSSRRHRRIAAPGNRRRLRPLLAGLPRHPERIPGGGSSGRWSQRDVIPQLVDAASADRGADGNARRPAGGLRAPPYLELYADSAQADAARRWRTIALNVAAMVLLSIVATYLVVAGFETVERWTNPNGRSAGDFRRLRGPCPDVRARGAHHRDGDELGAREPLPRAAGSVDGGAGGPGMKGAVGARAGGRRGGRGSGGDNGRSIGLSASGSGSTRGRSSSLARTEATVASFTISAGRHSPMPASRRARSSSSRSRPVRASIGWTTRQAPTRSASDPTTDHDGTGEPAGLHADRVPRALGDPCPQAPRSPAAPPRRSPASDTGSAQRVALVGWVESTTSDPTVAEMTAQGTGGARGRRRLSGRLRPTR